MTLHVRYSSHLDLLADELAEQLATPPADPFEPIVVAVPTAGVRDWLTRRLAERLGVAANIVMPFPGRFLAAALGTPLDADDPWEVDRLAWAVLDVLDSGGVDVPGWRGAPGGPLSRRYATARRIADLFDRYATTRPQILQQWSRGVAGDGTVGCRCRRWRRCRRGHRSGHRPGVAVAVRPVACGPRACRRTEPG